MVKPERHADGLKILSGPACRKVMKKIALFGGAFSPPHLGHASVIEAILASFPCDEIWIMPSADRHDKKISAAGEQRKEMLEIMISDLFANPEVPIVVSDLELKRNKPTTTYETKLELEEKYTDCRFYFVLSSENLGDIEKKWINGEKLYKEMNFVAIKNPNIPLPEKLPDHITILENAARLDISSTLVRDLIKNGFSGLPYLTKGVAEYIAKNHLYK